MEWCGWGGAEVEWCSGVGLGDGRVEVGAWGGDGVEVWLGWGLGGVGVRCSGVGVELGCSGVG